LYCRISPDDQAAGDRPERQKALYVQYQVERLGLIVTIMNWLLIVENQPAKASSTKQTRPGDAFHKNGIGRIN
jgi:hypothetical protein